MSTELSREEKRALRKAEKRRTKFAGDAAIHNGETQLGLPQEMNTAVAPVAETLIPQKPKKRKHAADENAVSSDLLNARELVLTWLWVLSIPKRRRLRVRRI